MPKTVWNDDFYVAAHNLARTGMTKVQAAGALGISHGTLKLWLASRPAFKRAWNEGAAIHADASGSTTTFLDYVYGQLPTDLQELWDDINAASYAHNGLARIQLLQRDHGKQARQELFFFALVHCNFNPSAACRKLGLSRQTYEQWCKEPRFLELMDQMEWHKKNFFEGALIRQVAKGNTKAIIHVNATVNKDRGYGRALDVKHSGTVEQTHRIIDDRILSLLPLSVRAALLDAFDRLDDEEQAQARLTVDAEAVHEHAS